VKNLNTNISALNKDRCTGCGSCFNACPKGAIAMSADDEGFLYPCIDGDLCNECGLCVKRCPALDVRLINRSDPPAYAFMASDAIRMKSSSGGVFTLASGYILDRGGYICGAAFNEDFSVSHIVISDPPALDKLRTSKYLQSDTNTVYTQIRELLAKKKPVLFSGCPCQVAGLYAFLGRDDDNLFTIDLICHGVPSPLAFKKYLQEKSKTDTVRAVNFRDKSEFGWASSLTIEYNNGAVSRQKGDSAFFKAFNEKLFFRKSCADCVYARIPRTGDLTIGDYWGVSEVNPLLSDGKGTSVVLVNNDKGAKYFSHISSKAKLAHATSLEQAKKSNGQLKYPAGSHPMRETFFTALREKSFTEAIDAVRKKTVGIIGVWYNPNYGSFLTNFALNRIVISFGYQPLMIDRPCEDRAAPPADNHSRRAANRYYKNQISRRYRLDEIGALNGFCDTFILGSDQLWSFNVCSPLDMYYFLGFADDTKKKISYATSFGKARFDAPAKYRKAAAMYLKRFDAVSVREDSAVKCCADAFDVRADHVIDPLMACDIVEYEALAAKSKVTSDGGYLLAYILDPESEIRNKIIEIASALSLKLYIILDGKTQKEEENRKKMNHEGVVRGLEIEDFLYYIRNCSLLITDSFHGSCVAMLFRRAFVCIGNERRGIARYTSLFSILGVKERLVRSAGEITEELCGREIDYDAVHALLKKERECSLAWLKAALDAPLREPYLPHARINKIAGRLIRQRRKKSPLRKKIERKLFALLKKVYYKMPALLRRAAAKIAGRR